MFTWESALLVEMLLTSFIDIGMLEEAISLFILLLQIHMQLHKAPFVIMLPVCASIDENYKDFTVYKCAILSQWFLAINC